MTSREVLQGRVEACAGQSLGFLHVKHFGDNDKGPDNLGFPQDSR